MSAGELTFAEAMALDPKEVEFDQGNGWRGLWDRQGMYPLAAFRTAKFRRAAPKRSRVQEMAEAKWPGPTTHTPLMIRDIDEQARAETILAVCQYLRKWDRPRQIEAAIDIEREFLEPR